jgi:hypothetical protein
MQGGILMFSKVDMPSQVTRAELHAELQGLATKEELRDLAKEIEPIATSMLAMTKLWPVKASSQEGTGESEKPQLDAAEELERRIHDRICLRLKLNDDVIHMRLSAILENCRHLHRCMERLEALCIPKAKSQRVRARR